MTDLSGRGAMGLKAPKPERGTSRARAHIERVKQLPCVICHAPGPSDAHHCICGRYGNRKVSDFEVIPLCKFCHMVGPTAIHNGKASWVAANGPDYEFLPVVADMLAGQWNNPRSK